MAQKKSAVKQKQENKVTADTETSAVTQTIKPFDGHYFVAYLRTLRLCGLYTGSTPVIGTTLVAVFA